MKCHWKKVVDKKERIARSSPSFTPTSEWRKNNIARQLERIHSVPRTSTLKLGASASGRACRDSPRAPLVRHTTSLCNRCASLNTHTHTYTHTHTSVERTSVLTWRTSERACRNERALIIVPLNLGHWLNHPSYRRYTSRERVQYTCALTHTCARAVGDVHCV